MTPELWSEDLTDAQLKMVIESGDHDSHSGFGVELNGPNWRTARALVAGGCGWIEGGAPNGSDLPGLYFNNAHGVEIVHEFEDEPDEFEAISDAIDAQLSKLRPQGERA